jgi:hypothetical protein
MKRVLGCGGLVFVMLCFVQSGPVAQGAVIVGHGMPPPTVATEWSVSDLEGEKSWAQAFTTPVSFRYELTSVKTSFRFTAGAVGATLWNSVSSPVDGVARPGPNLAADLGVQSFTGMDDLGVVTYSAPPGISLNPATTYWLVLTPTVEGALIYAPVVNYFSYGENAAQLGTGTFGARAIGDVAKNDWLILPGTHDVAIEGKAVPEPSSIASFLAGLSVLVCRARKRTTRILKAEC